VLLGALVVDSWLVVALPVVLVVVVLLPLLPQAASPTTIPAATRAPHHRTLRLLAIFASHVLQICTSVDLALDRLEETCHLTGLQWTSV
jgi:hypothetical protein